MLNISGTSKNDDPTYRYKMPRLESKIEGRGNGIKTVVTNMAAISEALNRPPSLPTKFFGTELGAQSRWEDETEKATVNGAHNTGDLQKLLNIFIDKFVLCPKCHLPETALVVRKQLIQHKCSACGAKEAVDMSHKLCTFILKEAATATAAAAKDAVGAAGAVRDAKQAKREKKERREAEKEKKEKKDKKPKKETAEGGDGAAATTAAGSSEDEDEGEDEDGVGTAGAGGPAEGPGATVGDGVQWHVDASKEAVAERRRIAEEARLDAALTSPSSRSALARTPSGGTADGFGPSDDRDDGATTGAVAEIAMALASSAKDVTLLVEAVSSAQTKRGMRASERAALYCRAAFDGGLVVQSKDSTHLAVLSALLVSKDPASASAGQHGLLSALQDIILSRSTELLRATPIVLQSLYEADVLDEDAIVAWAAPGAGADAQVLARAKPFLDWLATAAEEEEEEEED